MAATVAAAAAECAKKRQLKQPHPPNGSAIKVNGGAQCKAHNLVQAGDPEALLASLALLASASS